ncbi:MAG: TonB-dependent receptor, partial [Steroidobacteraceae bacterium]
VGYHLERGGYIDNVKLGIEDINDEEANGGRVQLRYQPNDAFTLDLAVHLQREDSQVGAWEHPLGDYRSLIPSQLPTQDDFELYNLTAKWDLGFATLTGVGSLFNRDLRVTIDGTRFIQSLRATPLAPFLPAFNESVLDQPQDIEDRSFELRLASNGEGPLVWTFGGYLENRDAFTDSGHVQTDPLTGLRVTPTVFVFHRVVDDVLEQRALFGEVSYDLTEALTLTAGTRYFAYDKEVTGATLVPFRPIGFPQVTPPQTSKFDEDGFVSKINLAYQLGTRALAYAQVSEGFRPGGVNQVVGLDQLLSAYEADSTLNYELGLKTRWFENRMTANFAAFRIDWEDMQVTGQSRTGQAVRFIANAGQAQVDGVELELVALPAKGLEVSLAGSYTDARLTENQVSADVAAPGRKGDRIPNVPEYAGSLAVQYGRPLGAALFGSLRTDVSYVGETGSEFRQDDVLFDRIDAYTVANMRLRLESMASNWNVDLFVNNVFDEVAIGRILSTRFGDNLTLSSPPRTIGLSLGKSF